MKKLMVCCVVIAVVLLGAMTPSFGLVKKATSHKHYGPRYNEGVNDALREMTLLMQKQKFQATEKTWAEMCQMVQKKLS